MSFLTAKITDWVEKNINNYLRIYTGTKTPMASRAYSTRIKNTKRWRASDDFGLGSTVYHKIYP